MPQRVNGIEEYRYFFTDSDLAAMEWIKANTPEDAVFAINATLWLVNSPHGTDGGYWIPYFTGRKTTVSTMLFSLGLPTDVERIRQQAGLVATLGEESPQLQALCSMGVEYLYNGEKGNFTGIGFNQENILKDTHAKLLYQNEDVFIIKLCE
jgi:hypothetical protein